MRIYADPSHYLKDHRYHLNDIAKALWNDRSPEEREQVYGEWVHNYIYTPHIEEADVVLLTMKWNYYVERNLVALAENEIRNARSFQKKVIVFSGGDAPANYSHPDMILFESGGYRSAQGLAYHSGHPFFLKDYLDVYCGGELQKHKKFPIPTIGFCGQAGSSSLRKFFRFATILIRKFEYWSGQLKWQPPPFETTGFRRRVLRQFEGHSRVKSNFLVREQYHAGKDQEKDDFNPQKMAFVRNILDSDYTVCMRGGGNFSIRFYETLSLGRIPVFIDTDCLLPFDDKIPYRQIFPWISIKDLPRIAEIVADFHQSLSDNDFDNLQETCRKLWLEHFTPNGFHSDLREKIYELQ